MVVGELHHDRCEAMRMLGLQRRGHGRGRAPMRVPTVPLREQRVVTQLCAEHALSLVGRQRVEVGRIEIDEVEMPLSAMHVVEQRGERRCRHLCDGALCQHTKLRVGKTSSKAASGYKQGQNTKGWAKLTTSALRSKPIMNMASATAARSDLCTTPSTGRLAAYCDAAVQSGLSGSVECLMHERAESRAHVRHHKKLV
eukprot:2117310-Prymnesium_polylepis.2